MLKDIEAVIFDMDGTLVDSMWVWEKIDIEYINGRGYEIPNDFHKSIEGMSFTETAIYVKDRFRIGDLKQSSVEEFWNSKQRIDTQEWVNPSVHCGFNCLRHESNLEIFDMIDDIKNKKNVQIVGDFDPFI